MSLFEEEIEKLSDKVIDVINEYVMENDLNFTDVWWSVMYRIINWIKGGQI